MSKESLLRRMLSSQSGVDQRKLQTGFLGREDHGKLQHALEQLVEARMFIDDSAGISLAEMRAKARRLKQNSGGLDLIVVDYLQLMSATLPSMGGKRYENRTQEVSAISRGLKALAKELNVPVIALSQLSRASERRGDDKRPMLSDLRESGSIEQDADVVAFIHREAYYNRDEEISDADKAIFDYVRSNRLSTSTDERLYATIMACRSVVERQIEGDFVECGVWRGGNSVIAAAVFKAMKADPALAAIPTLGFVSHVQTDLIEAARQAGVGEVVARSAFAGGLADILSRGNPRP